MTASRPAVCVVGHPYGPLGTSRLARSSFASLRAVGVEAALRDIWGQTRPDAAHEQALEPYATKGFGDFNLFHLNGDEIEAAIERVGGLPSGARNAVAPMWELPRYPAEWARQLERFDEVWAGSRFIADAIRPAVSTPVVHMPVATQATPRVMRSRRYFSIPEGAYAFVLFLDLRSYLERKNPLGVLAAFEGFLKRRPWAQACLVVKVHGTANAPEAAADLARRLAELEPRVMLIDRQMPDDEVHALIYNCDAYVSLHRAEGVGLGLAEAMSLGKPTIGTAYSGNMDFMNPRVARLVRYELVPVPEGAYPHWQDQMWAEPDIDAATRAMVRLYDDPEAGRRLGRKASQHMQAHFSFRAVGLRYLAHIETIGGGTGSGDS